MMDFVDFKTLKRPASPNNYLMSPSGLCEQSTPDHRSEPLPVSPDDLYKTIVQVVSDRPGWELARHDEKRRLIHFIATSKIMRYKDDVDVLVLPNRADNGEEARLAIYSRSRIGYSDLGANKKRVNELLDRLKHVQVAT